jgi:hypothetical protein
VTEVSRLFKFFAGLAQIVVILPLIVLLIALIFVLTVLGSFGRTWDIVKSAAQRGRYEASQKVSEPKAVKPEDFYKVYGIDYKDVS